MSLWKLRLSMAGTLAVIFGLSTLVFAVVMSLAGVFDIVTLGVLVVVINIVQWLAAPYVVGALYKVREMREDENPQLFNAVKNLSMKSEISAPKLMLAQIPLPNAFAYGSPLSGSRIAVTEGLLNTLDSGEVEAVVGHELGHLKHKDVQAMMVVSFLPALFYYIGYSLWISMMYQGERRNEGGSALMGMGFMAFSWVLNMFILYLSRLREYYADRHSVSVVDDGAQRLSLGLAKIVNASKRFAKNQRSNQNLNAFKALFISDPDRAVSDSESIAAMHSPNSQDLIQEIISKEPTFGDNLLEAFSTHPNIIKRLRALQALR